MMLELIKYGPAIIGAIALLAYIGALVFYWIIARAFRGRINHHD